MLPRDSNLIRQTSNCIHQYLLLLQDSPPPFHVHSIFICCLYQSARYQHSKFVLAVLVFDLARYFPTSFTQPIQKSTVKPIESIRLYLLHIGVNCQTTAKTSRITFTSSIYLVRLSCLSLRLGYVPHSISPLKSRLLNPFSLFVCICFISVLTVRQP